MDLIGSLGFCLAVELEAGELLKMYACEEPTLAGRAWASLPRACVDCERDSVRRTILPGACAIGCEEEEAVPIPPDI